MESALRSLIGGAISARIKSAFPPTAPVPRTQTRSGWMSLSSSAASPATMAASRPSSSAGGASPFPVSSYGAPQVERSAAWHD